MLVEIANHQTISAADGTTTTSVTRPIRMNGVNYANLTLNILSITDLSGSPTTTLTAKAQGSNDGVNFEEITGFGPSYNQVGLNADEGSVTFAWLRLELELIVAGSPGETADVVFDLQANVMRK